ncbi:hypothetical protein GZ77_02115 [Endozoicomonas montiporae]|uniref:Transposase DDE domain-containing protein n=2 Tax=Endozoicomonas montiporae TaxID=1027273 RepID=A0A081NAI9_9GAMM|nr:hypothetical protein GZ77_02115 [Endozoicomonas montiporae]
MVEPVFGYLRTVQNLNRFRHRGLSSVKLECSLHLLAYNLSRVVAARFWIYLMLLSGYQRHKSLFAVSGIGLDSLRQKFV